MLRLGFCLCLCVEISAGFVALRFRNAGIGVIPDDSKIW